MGNAFDDDKVLGLTNLRKKRLYKTLFSYSKHEVIFVT